MKQFPCTQCGLCCLALDKIPVLHDFHHGDGKCIYYVQSQGCSIYHSRPLVCRIDEMYQTYFQKDFKKIDFYEKMQKFVINYSNNIIIQSHIG